MIVVINDRNSNKANECVACSFTAQTLLRVGVIWPEDLDTAVKICEQVSVFSYFR